MSARAETGAGAENGAGPETGAGTETGAGVSVTLRVPGALAPFCGGRREIALEVPVGGGGAPSGSGAAAGAETASERGAEGPSESGGPAVEVAPGSATTLSRVLDRLAEDLPALERRIRDERAEIRRHVNLYVNGTDIRTLSGADTTVPDGAAIDVIAAVSGG